MRRHERGYRWTAIVAIGGALLGTACVRSESVLDAGDGGRQLGDAGPDSGDAQIDSSTPDSAVGDSATGDAGDAHTLTAHCPDEPVPGFRMRPDGLYTPCACFNGDPLRPVATWADEGLRTVPFSCDWPEGMIYRRRYLTYGDAIVTRESCDYNMAGGVPEGFVPEPVEERFIATVIAADPNRVPVPLATICIPVECVFDTPGEPARCSAECYAATTVEGQESAEYRTIYRVDRSVCP